MPVVQIFPGEVVAAPHFCRRFGASVTTLTLTPASSNTLPSENTRLASAALFGGHCLPGRLTRPASDGVEMVSWSRCTMSAIFASCGFTHSRKTASTRPICAPGAKPWPRLKT